MSEDETRDKNHEEETDEVEAHGRKLKAANDEGKSDETEGDDFEAHSRHLKA
jgi:hypothetical protein